VSPVTPKSNLNPPGNSRPFLFRFPSPGHLDDSIVHFSEQQTILGLGDDSCRCKTLCKSSFPISVTESGLRFGMPMRGGLSAGYALGRMEAFYLGLLLGHPSVAKTVSLPTAKQVSIKYQDLEGIPVPKSSRVSFKVSGEIHFGDAVLHGKPLTSLAKARQLCVMNFAHPSRYRAPEKKNPNDFDIAITGSMFGSLAGRLNELLRGATMRAPYIGLLSTGA
jgi:hypothetical protein